MQEKIIQFGPENSMVGIVTVPEKIINSRPAILILNSGLVHRVGPYRMGVLFARNLAASGFLVFRFDLPNVGDSLPYKTSENYKQRTITEISSAMDVISLKYQVSDFVSVGLCTGAMNSHVISVADRRVKGAVMLDAYAYPTLKFLYKRYSGKLLKLFHPDVFKRIYNIFFKKNSFAIDTEFSDDVSYWKQPPKKEVRDELITLMNRNIDLLYIYSGGAILYYNYENQFRDSFRDIDFKEHLQVHFLSKMDHTFTLQRDRDYVLSFMAGWIKDKYSNGSE